MKLIVAVIQPAKLNAVREALDKIEVARMTVCDAQNFGRMDGEPEISRSDEEAARLVRKIVLEVIVNDDFLQRTVETIANVAKIGSEGAAGVENIFVLPVDEAVQIDDGSRGPGAV